MWRGSHIILKIALAWAFLYPAVSVHFHPYSWLGYLPQFLQAFLQQQNISQTTLIWGFSVVHTIIGLWILFGRHSDVPATLAGLFLLGVLIFNYNQMDVLFRDISLLFVCVALIMQNRSLSRYYSYD